MATFSFKESVKIYVNSGSNVFVCFLDATKAFVRVNRAKLFSILKTRKVPEYLMVFCPTGTPIKKMLSVGVMQFHRTLRFLTAFVREVFFVLYYTISIRTV